jgi:hypothetical protein
MKSRSPLLGYNHNIRYAGRLYHVQTEDSGLQNPHVFTHLFFGGTILASKKTDYSAEDPDNQVQKVMQAQHKGMLKDLRAGAFDSKLEKHFGEPVVRDAAPVEVEPADSKKTTLPPVDEPPRIEATTPARQDPTPLPPELEGVEPTPLATPLPGRKDPTPLPLRADPTPLPPPRPPSVTPLVTPAVPARDPQPLAARRDTTIEQPMPPELLEIADETARVPRMDAVIEESIHDLPTAQLSDLLATPLPSPAREVPAARPPQSPPRPAPRVRDQTDPDLQHPAFPPPQHRQPVPPRRPTGSRPHVSSPYGNKPSAEGVVVARPAVIVSDVVTSRAPVQPRRSGQVPVTPPPAAREPVVENIFGEDLVSEKSLDEVILAYLADDLPGK